MKENSWTLTKPNNKANDKVQDIKNQVIHYVATIDTKKCEANNFSLNHAQCQKC